MSTEIDTEQVTEDAAGGAASEPGGRARRPVGGARRRGSIVHQLRDAVIDELLAVGDAPDQIAANIDAVDLTQVRLDVTGRQPA